MRSRRFFRAEDEDDDPVSSLVNLFDLAMVLAVGLMVALVTHFQVPEFLTQENVTFVKNPGKEDMEIILKQGKKITKYKGTQGAGSGKGRRVGAAYELENGDIIYVPE
ncbi:MAG: DUF2149 domain-containing protein [Verrucomicrobia bacterium]|nr:DUF2149 domain-containing protein [Verrucomicrobiota bacterium]